MTQQLRIHKMLAGIRTLGPFDRFVIWTQGCRRRCPGCISPSSRSFDGGKVMDIDAVARRVLRHGDCEGLTISGGEPFLQAAGLCALIDALRAQRDLGVIVYTGYTLEELQEPDAPYASGSLLSRLDLLIDGPYIEALNDDKSLRGSSNQRVIPLTDRYLSQLPLYGADGDRRIELRAGSDGIFAAGIPSKEIAKQLVKNRKGEE